MSDEIQPGGIDATIDAVARRMTGGDPGAAFRVRVLDGIGTPAARPTGWRRVGPAVAVVLLTVCAGFVAWRLAGPSVDQDRIETARRAGPPTITLPGVRSSRPQPEAAQPTTDTSRDATAREAGARAGRRRPAWAPVLAGHLAERMAGEPGAIRIEALPAPAPPPLPRVAFEAVTVEAIGLDPLDLQAIDGDGARE